MSLQERALGTARTPRGAFTIAIAIVALVLLVVVNPALRLLIVAALLVCAGLWMWAIRSERAWRRRSPPIPKFAKRPADAGMKTMLRKDNNAQISPDHWRFLWRRRRRWWFVGTGCPPQELSESRFETLSSQKDQGPVRVAGSGDRQYWWWRDQFYWDNHGYEPDDVKAVVLMHERQNRKQLEHAHDLMAAEDSPQPRKREQIPEDVRRLVFRRDEGRCQSCGSTELLQFDHIIPLTMGGSNDPENLQLLCAPCNREKSGKL